MRDRNLLRIIISTLMLATLFLLNGCSSYRGKDGPPPYPVDVSRIPDAVPKKEARSKYGNYRSYIVYNKRYYTLPTSKGYEQQGIASWYGRKFHKLRTSSGERYDMLGMTAAHKTLPLPTYVQVTNLRNGKHVIVKVNDRGPFEGNRLIDLSYVAAKKLDMLGHGTTRVDVKAIDPDEYYRNQMQNPIPIMLAHNHTSTSHHHIPHRPATDLYLQVGVFKNRLYAEKLKDRVSRVLTSSPVHITQLHSTHYYHVQIGPIHDVATQQRISLQLKSMGLASTKKIFSHSEV